MTVRVLRSRDLLTLVAMWGVGALLLATVVIFTGQGSRARQGQLLAESIQQQMGPLPAVAANVTPATRTVVLARLAAAEAAVGRSAVELAHMGEPKRAASIQVAIGQFFASSRLVVGLVLDHRRASALAVTTSLFTSGGPGTVLVNDVQRTNTSFRRQGERFEERASITTFVLTVVLLVAFSLALYRSVLARRRAEALAGDKQVLLEQTESDAGTDALTGLPNRRRLFSDTDRALRERPEGGSVTLGVFDLDGFKGYNDSFGHPAGDALLAHLGQRLGLSLLGRADVYRMGGDEFCVVTTEPDAASVLLAASAALTEHGERFVISCSYGAAAIPSEASTLEQALQLADRRLYGHKDPTRSTESVQIKDALMQVLAEQGEDLVPHLGRVAELAGETGLRLGLPVYEIARIRLAAELHDIGKAAVPGAILQKAGPLDTSELGYLRQHSVIGERILAAAPALAGVAPLVRATHERADGSGYPDGLRLEQIPVGSRVIAVVDAFDAMTSDRPYQAQRTVDDARAELLRGAGTQFDPAVVQAFLAVIDDRVWHGLRTASDDAYEQLVGAAGARAPSRARSGRRAHRT